MSHHTQSFRSGTTDLRSGTKDLRSGTKDLRSGAHGHHAAALARFTHHVRHTAHPTSDSLAKPSAKEVGITFAQQFAIGGAVVGITSIIALYISTKWASLFWSIPFTLFPVIIVLYLQTKKDKGQGQAVLETTNFAGQTFISLIVLLFLVGTLWICMYTGMPFWKSAGTSIGVWAAVALVYALVVCPSPFKGGKCISVNKVT